MMVSKGKTEGLLILELLTLLGKMLSEYFVLLKIIVNRIVLLVILCRFEFVP